MIKKQTLYFLRDQAWRMALVTLLLWISISGAIWEWAAMIPDEHVYILAILLVTVISAIGIYAFTKLTLEEKKEAAWKFLGQFAGTLVLFGLLTFLI